MLRLFCLVLFCTGTATAQTPNTDYGTGHPAFEAALNYAIPFGKSIVARGDTLIPFGLAVTEPGVPNVVMVQDATLTGQQALMMTVETLRSMSVQGFAAEGESPRPVTGVALVLDILTDVPGRPGKTDALSVILEAPDVAQPASYVLPYVRDDEGGIRYLDSYWRPQPPVLWVR